MHKGRRRFGFAPGGELGAEFQMALACAIDEGMPDGVDEIVFDEEAPDAVRPFVEIGHESSAKAVVDLLKFRQLSRMSVKDQVLQAIHRLPDDINYRDVADEIAFLAAVREAERDIDEGRVVRNEQMKTQNAEWSAS